MIRKSSLFVVTFLIIFSCSGPKAVTIESDSSSKNVKQVILMIGDGMGLSQVSAALYAKQKDLNLEKFQHIGLQKTHAKDALITDSAAAATAMARGTKANNNTFGSTDKVRAPSSILEICQKKGWKSGIVVTSELTHATPAAFYTYQDNRGLSEGIARDLSTAGVDILIGGGKKFFDNRDSDEDNLVDNMIRDGYVVETFFEKEKPSVLVEGKKYVYFMANDKPLPIHQGRLPLAELCQTGLQFLRERGDEFFLLVEGSQIDWGGHSNDSEYVIEETLDFDRAVGAMLRYAKNHNNVLLVVTADHETGGLSIKDKFKSKLLIDFNSKLHTGTMVPVYAYGPGSETFQGIYDNTEIYSKILDLIN